MPESIVFGSVYVVTTKENSLFRIVRKGSDSNKILLVPENKEFDSREINKSEVLAVYQALGKITVDI